VHLVIVSAETAITLRPSQITINPMRLNETFQATTAEVPPKGLGAGFLARTNWNTISAKNLGRMTMMEDKHRLAQDMFDENVQDLRHGQSSARGRANKCESTAGSGNCK
jgi:hypothetical protein